MSLNDAAAEVVPVLRGVSHFWALWLAAAASVVLVVLADSGDARVSGTIYGLGLCALFGGSALYHRWRWNPRWKPVLRRVDHATIFVFIAASYTPIGILVLTGSLQVVLLIVIWVGAIAGAVFSVAWVDAPRWLQAVLYIGLGWVAIVAFPDLVDRLPAAPFALIATGGCLYTAGAVVYARRRPDPWPATFGFHEIFHAFVIAAAVCHYTAIAGWIIL